MIGKKVRWDPGLFSPAVLMETLRETCVLADSVVILGSWQTRLQDSWLQLRLGSGTNHQDLSMLCRLIIVMLPPMLICDQLALCSCQKTRFIGRFHKEKAVAFWWRLMSKTTPSLGAAIEGCDESQVVRPR